MKLTWVFVVLLMVTTELAAQEERIVEPYMGLNIGGSLGTSALAFKHYSFDAKGVKYQDHNHGNSGFAMAINGSYRSPLCNRWTLGPEAHVQYNFAKVLRVTVPDTPIALNTTDWNYGVAGELGYAIAKNNLLFVLVGPEFASSHSEYSYLNPTVSGNAAKILFGVMLGVGAEQVLSKHFHISEQINYGWFNSITTNMSDGGSKKDQLRLSTGMITLSYHV